MYRKAVNYLRGQAVAEVVCTAPERVVNLCAAHGIPFWDLTWLTETSFRVTTTLSGARRLAEVTADIGAQVTVCRKSGAPELWRRCRRDRCCCPGWLTRRGAAGICGPLGGSGPGHGTSGRCPYLWRRC